MAFSISILIFVLLSVSSSGLEVDCDYEADRNKISCRCLTLDQDSFGSEDISSIISRFTSNRFRNLVFRFVELRDCRNLDIILDLRAFVVDNRVQNISDISFRDVEDLHLRIANIDYGNKRFVFDGVDVLQISGTMAHPSTSVRIFIRSNPNRKGDVIFKDLEARSQIPIINIQDARSVRVVDSVFENLRLAEIIRTERCHTTLVSSETVDCRMEELFFSSPIATPLRQVVSHPLFIAVMGIFIIAILLAIFAVIYVKHWKKRKELELLGYPASAAFSPRSTPTSSGRISQAGHFGPAKGTTRRISGGVDNNGIEIVDEEDLSGGGDRRRSRRWEVY